TAREKFSGRDSMLSSSPREADALRPWRRGVAWVLMARAKAANLSRVVCISEGHDLELEVIASKMIIIHM
ncbi:MAG: hypothetical protein M0P52_14320, partial [Rhodoferax sp.]|nr:hypothetical protein [Rhodoferax sp.]